MSLPDIYLASSSPRRRELLDQLGVQYALVAQAVPERLAEGESPEAYVRRLAEEKAVAGWTSLSAIDRRPVLGADTAVVVDEQVLGKPLGRADGLAMLALLSGRRHRVLTAVALVSDGPDPETGAAYQVVNRLSESWVDFRALDGAERAAYWASGEPVGKAGAYAIQGRGAMFIERLEGSYSGVMGLPLFETAELLQAVGLQVGVMPAGQ